MAWPSTALTTYVAGVAPAIQAFDLNAFQSAINGIVNATYALKAVVVDGIGGSVVVPLAGTTQVSAELTENTTPGTARSAGIDCKGTRDFGWAVFNGSGVFKRGYNCKSVSRTGVGQYTVLFYGNLVDDTFAMVYGTASSPGVALSITPAVANSLGDLLVTIDVRDGTNTLTDALVRIGVKGE